MLGCSITGLPLPDRYLIQQHPEVEAKLVAELDKAGLLLTPQRLTPRAMEYADLAHLTYLSWVCKANSHPVRMAMSEPYDACAALGAGPCARYAS